MYKKTFFFVPVIMAIVCCIPACQPEPLPDGMPDLVVFKVKITQNGDPLPDARVRLLGKNGRWPIDGVTNGAGVALMRTQLRYPGVPCDEYRILVTKLVETPSKYKGEEEPSEEDDPAAWSQWQEKLAAEYRPTHSYVNKKYSDEETSDLSVDVFKPGSIVIDVGAPVDDLIIPAGTAPRP
ncbi:MAG: hypothetical protein Q4G68_13320 [Planctomycetia bacterium]|nr:hypothetical protein [Planctomycetia bacterium]